MPSVATCVPARTAFKAAIDRIFVLAPDRVRAKAPPPPGQAPGRPFDVTEYTQAATEISRAAGELNQLLGALGTRGPELGTAVGASVEQGRTLVDYLFVRAAWLIGLLLGGLLAVLLAYRWLAPRIRPA